jgi:hypothetical protein
VPLRDPQKKPSKSPVYSQSELYFGLTQAEHLTGSLRHSTEREQRKRYAFALRELCPQKGVAVSLRNGGDLVSATTMQKITGGGDAPPKCRCNLW